MTIQLPGGEHWYDLQWSSAVYKNYIFIFGGSGVSGKIYWIDINDLPGFCGSPCSEGSNNVPCAWTSAECLMDPPYTFGEKSQKVPKRWSEGVAFAHNIYGSPAFISVGGRKKIGDGNWQPSGNGEFLFVDADTPDHYSQHEMRELGSYNSSYGPAMAQIGDNIVLVDVDSTTNDIFLWNYNDARPELVGTLSRPRKGAVPAVISGRFFPKCMANEKLKFKHNYTSCIEAYKTSGFINPKNSVPVTISDSGKLLDKQKLLLLTFSVYFKCTNVSTLFLEIILSDKYQS